tara:strand:- start:864 stop:2183 length:1320 start_codon:yes stop_codon:yes gene_type:complete
MSIKDNFPSVGPSLSLNFARSKILDPRITFSRTSVGTYTNGNGLIVTGSADEPRFDHEYENGVVKSLGLLVEEQRTNSVRKSEDFTIQSGRWSENGDGVTVTTNQAVAPDGNTTADKVAIKTSGSGSKGIQSSILTGTSSGTAITSSIFCKADDHSYVRVQMEGGGNTGGIVVDLSDGSLITEFSSPDSYKIEPYPNDWYRISVTSTTASTAATALRVFLTDSSGNANWTGTIGDGVYLWGGQHEIGAFPTSYIPTDDTAGGIMRTADNVTMTGTNFSDWYNQEQGAMVWIGNVYSKESRVHPFRINRTNGGNLRGMGIQFDTRSVSNTVNFISRTQSSNIPTKNGPTGVIPSDNKIKIVGGYIESVGLSTIRAAFNGLPAVSYGGASQTDIVDGAMNELEIMGNRGVSGTNLQFTGVCEQLVYYPKIFTDTQLQNLTK